MSTIEYVVPYVPLCLTRRVHGSDEVNRRLLLSIGAVYFMRYLHNELIGTDSIKRRDIEIGQAVWSVCTFDATDAACQACTAVSCSGYCPLLFGPSQSVHSKRRPMTI